MTSPFPPVDYLSRDYAAIREDLIAGIPSRIPEWTSRDSSDFGIALIELFAYMGDGLHYYIDRMASESFLATATQRRSVLDFARLLDYRPGGNQAATVELVLANSLAAPAVVPAGTRVSTAPTASGQIVYFETQVEVTVPANVQITVEAIEGVTVSLEEVGTSTGVFDQDFLLRESPVIEGSVTVSVSEAGGAIWAFYAHLLDAAPSDPAYTLLTDERGRTHVVFGDDVNGKVPAPGAPVRARYRVGGGLIGNVGPGQITRIVSTVPAGVTVTNQTSATGGSDAETLEEIKRNAPRSLYTLGRAVTVDDYATLAVQVGPVGQAQVISTHPRVVTIYVVPRAGGPLTAELHDEVQAYLEPRKQAGTTVVVLGPDYVATNIQISIDVQARYVRQRVQQSALKLLRELLALDAVILGDRITLGDIYSYISAIDGVASVKVDVLERDGIDPEPTSADAVFRDHEVPVEGDVSVVAYGGIAG